ncbi:aspartate--tRNA(Asn) ligase [Acetatifactor muris]|uniref:Aspartate--tRNA ligase n=1 Tax=Acetatifactor muris TaxID=879566 RepID=A0A2K4ZMV1_9FIRM|nr:aspartate--tRNA(Asn) ligase [Acetatifactor muris]MCR2050167.1 aspartate--tRNA(Asn) ligase [Acetatifactor muris]SOY31829.1 Asparagine--tRNA ligase [Acetatifactor muris]
MKEKKIQDISEISELAEHIGETVTLHGSIYKIRKMKGFYFCRVRTPRDVIQCVCDRQELMEKLREEACVRITAEAVKEERAKAGVELYILSVVILSEPLENMPVVINQKEMSTSLENKLNFRPLTLRNEKERAIFRIQEGILRGFRHFFEEEHFVEIHTPKIVYAGAEGGANVFRVDYFGREAYLAQSPQFYKQMMAGVFERVYEVGPVFRAEKHDTARHINEYTGVDFEMGYIESFRELMALEVKMLRCALNMLSREYAHELELLQVTLPELPEENEPNAVSAVPGGAIPELKFTEAKELLAEELGLGEAAREQAYARHDFEPEEEKMLSEIIWRRTGSEFVFITHYPAAKRPFYVMEDPESPEETLSFDLIFRGLEITTGGQRIHDYNMQVEKMCRRGMNPEAFESYLMMHKHGMPPHGGLGLGLERFTARLLNFDNIRQAALFPRDIHRLTP